MSRTSSGIRLVLATTITGALLASITAGAAAAGPRSTRLAVERQPGPRIEVRKGAFTGSSTAVGGPVRALDGRARPAGSSASTFVVSYTGFSTAARKAFQSAVDYWAATIVSPVPIRIKATFKNLPGNLLGAAGPTQIVRAFPGAVSNTWYPIALGSRIAGTDLAPGAADIVAQFDSSAPWDFGIDNVVPSTRYSFRSVVLHELAHGLGFAGSMRRTSDGKGRWGNGNDGRPFIFDRFAEKNDGTALLSLANNSTALGNALVSGNLWSDHGATSRSKLYAPGTFQPGSSYSHWNEGSYPRGHIDSLMTPAIGPGEGIATAGPRTLSLFDAMGWGDPSPTACKKPHDLSGDGLNDLLGVDASGTLKVVAGNGTGGFQGTLSFTPPNAWTGTNLLAVSPDLNGDGCTDFVVRILSQVLLYASDGTAGFNQVDLGSHPGITALLAPGDVDKDGNNDLVVRNADGSLSRWEGDGEGDFAAPVQMATGFGSYTEIVGPGDFDKDGKVDLLVRTTANGGTLRLFRGNGTGGLVSPSIKIGEGWNDFDELLSARDVTGDGRSDLYGRLDGEGDIVLLRGDGAGSIKPPFLIYSGGFDTFGTLD